MTTTHPKRRFFSYSLRTLMLVVTVFCVWMGMTAKRARDQKWAVEAILEVGGRVYYEHENLPLNEMAFRLSGPYYRQLVPGLTIPDPPGSEWLREHLGDEYFFNIYGVILDGPKVNDAGLAAIKRLPDVKWVSLHTMQVTDAGVAHLKGMTNLQFLELSSTQVTDAGLENLKGLTKLQELDLYNTKITDAGLEHLKGLTSLRIVAIKYTHITDEGVKKLQQALPNLQIIR